VDKHNNYINNVVEKYSDMIVRVAFSYMKNIYDAEDVTQDTLLKLIKKSPQFENESHEKAWLIRVAINNCKNRLKTVWFKKILSLQDHIYDFTDFTPKENEVIHAVLKLSAKYRTVIYLFYFEGYSIVEIASILDCKESTIGSRLHRARKLLKFDLEDIYNE
jgi:RNA polymerase sigma-70 factor (ECF subfamily)